MFENIVFEGGGVKGVGFIGALEALEKNRVLHNIKNIAGTSAGGGFAALYAIGYRNKELRDITFRLDFNKFKDDSYGFIRDTRRILGGFGLYKGDAIKVFYEDLFYKKTRVRNITFRRLYEMTGKKLILTGTCINDKCIKYFSVDTTPNMPIADAVRITVSIPLVFKPVLHDNKYYVDGGLLSNFPTECFDHSDTDGRRTVNNKTISVRLDTESEFKKSEVKIDSFFSFINEIMDTILKNAYKTNYATDEDTRKIIKINTADISATDFDITVSQKNMLYKNGIDATHIFLKETSMYKKETQYSPFIVERVSYWKRIPIFGRFF